MIWQKLLGEKKGKEAAACWETFIKIEPGNIEARRNNDLALNFQAELLLLAKNVE